MGMANLCEREKRILMGKFYEVVEPIYVCHTDLFRKGYVIFHTHRLRCYALALMSC